MNDSKIALKNELPHRSARFHFWQSSFTKNPRVDPPYRVVLDLISVRYRADKHLRFFGRQPESE